MTETDWLTGYDVIAMLQHMRHRYTLRHARLFAVACCRASPAIMRCDDTIWRGVLALEAQADMDRPVNPDSRQWVYEHWRDVLQRGFIAERFVAVAVQQLLRIERHSGASNVTPSHASWPLQLNIDNDTLVLHGNYNDADLEFLQTHVNALRDIVGNPFQPVAWEPRWATGDVMQMAQMIYDWHAFEQLPILGDALMDAGCEEEIVIAHCHEPHHVRGCWLLDTILGKG